MARSVFASCAAARRTIDVQCMGKRDADARQKAPAPHGAQCLCELCSCSKNHRCPVHGEKSPQKAKSRSRFEGEASYMRDYVAPPGEAYRGAFANDKDRRGDT